MLKEYWNRTWQPLDFHLPSLLFYSAVSVSPSRGSSISACGYMALEKRIGLGGNFQRLRNIRDLVDEILGFRFSWAFMFNKPNESYQLHVFKGIHSKMKIRSSCIPSLYNSNGWKYIWKNIVKKKNTKKRRFTSHSAFCFEWHDVCA